ncbi:hypothetical protein Dimus_015386, partial [Dionaea muscipula]
MAMVMMTAASMGAWTAAHGGVSSDNGRDGARRITAIGMGCGAARRGRSRGHGGFLVFANDGGARCLGGSSGRTDGRVWWRPSVCAQRRARTASCGSLARVDSDDAVRDKQQCVRVAAGQRRAVCAVLVERARGARTALRRARAAMRSAFSFAVVAHAAGSDVKRMVVHGLHPRGDGRVNDDMMRDYSHAKSSAASVALWRTAGLDRRILIRE